MNQNSISKIHSRIFCMATAMLLFALVLVASLGGFIFEHRAEAASSDPEFVFYYDSDDPATVAGLIDDLKPGNRRDGARIKATKILVKNGPTGGAGEITLDYDLETTTKMTHDFTFDDKGEYYFSKLLYCDTATKKITLTKPADAAEYVEMLYVAGFTTDWGDKAEFAIKEDTSYEGGVGVEKATTVTRSNSGGSDARTQQFDHRDSSAQPHDLGDGADGGVLQPSGCNPQAYDTNVLNYGKLSASKKDEYKDQVTAITAAASGGGGGGSTNGDAPDCDAKLNSPLSWIICPVVDMGTAFTDFVFDKFVRGMLEDVPVTTEDNNGTYLAWKQFRILGNVVLVGTLLMVVYSQARGGK